MSVDELSESYFVPRPGRRFSLAPQLAVTGDGDRCESCSIKSPPQTRKRREDGVSLTKEVTVPFRTKEEIHICTENMDSDDEEVQHTSRCHTHNVEYVSSSSPLEPETFGALRKATVRTLSGEQLPRGQRLGPVCFGDSTEGYTIAYYFRLADFHARGKERYYALIALVGMEQKRAWESCTLIWDMFEHIALRIIGMASEALQKNKPKTMADRTDKENVTLPVSSFLTQRALDPDGVSRRGAESVRANNITELVDNVNFFCELHMMFVQMLQELGKLFGGIRIHPKHDENYFLTGDTTNVSDFPREKHDGENEEDNFRMSPIPQEASTPKFMTGTIPTFDIPRSPIATTPTPSSKRPSVLG